MWFGFKFNRLCHPCYRINYIHCWVILNNSNISNKFSAHHQNLMMYSITILFATSESFSDFLIFPKAIVNLINGSLHLGFPLSIICSLYLGAWNSIAKRMIFFAWYFSLPWRTMWKIRHNSSAHTEDREHKSIHITRNVMWNACNEGSSHYNCAIESKMRRKVNDSKKNVLDSLVLFKYMTITFNGKCVLAKSSSKRNCQLVIPLKVLYDRCIDLRVLPAWKFPKYLSCMWLGFNKKKWSLLFPSKLDYEQKTKKETREKFMFLAKHSYHECKIFPFRNAGHDIFSQREMNWATIISRINLKICMVFLFLSAISQEKWGGNML